MEVEYLRERRDERDAEAEAGGERTNKQGDGDERPGSLSVTPHLGPRISPGSIVAEEPSQIRSDSSAAPPGTGGTRHTCPPSSTSLPTSLGHIHVDNRVLLIVLELTADDPLAHPPLHLLPRL